MTGQCLHMAAMTMLVGAMTVFAAGEVVTTSLSTAPASQPAVPPSPERIRQTVRELGHPQPARRHQAARQLATWGPSSLAELHRAAHSNDLETALASRELLAQFQSMMFLGGQVRLKLDRDRIAWDEPLAFTLRLDNISDGPVRVPWSATPASAPEPAVSTKENVRILTDAEQTGRMLDISDFLIVTGPGGERVELRVDPIENDPEVERAVRLRAGESPPTHLVSAGSSSELCVWAFNRGWARYPTLEAGTYTIVLEYQPQWADESWTADGLGRVHAGPIHFEVTKPAPLPVREAERPLQLYLQHRGESLAARLLCTWDRPVWVNLNFGPRLDLHARLQWQVLLPSQDEPVTWELEPSAADAGFNRDRLRRLDPGEEIELTSVSMSELREHAAPPISPEAIEVKIGLRYLQLVTSPRIAEQLTNEPKTRDLPPIFTGSVIAEPIALEKGSP